MWIEQRGDHYIAIERYKDYLTGKTRRVSVPMEKDTAQARKRAERALQAKIDAQAEKPSTVTLEALKTAYIAYQKRTVKASTVKRNNTILSIVVGIIGKDALCDRLTAGSIMTALTATGKENVTVNTYLTRLKAMLRWGYQNDMCPDIAGKLKPLPDRSEREKISDKFLEKADLKRLLDGMEVEQWRNLSRLLALSGLRIGEAVALTYSDFDLKSRLIHVTKTFAPTTKIVTPPKTADSVRDVFMQNELLKLCRKLLTGAKRRALECGYSSNLIFCDAFGKHISYDAYEKYLRENSERILGRKVTSHIMRHTMTSLFAEAGVDLDIIARRLGHHDSKLTRDIYLHCTQAQTERDHEAVKNVKIL
jgi:integrase